MPERRSTGLLALLVLAVAAVGCERPEQAPATRPASTARDEEYAAALAVADAFCHAWQVADAPAGRGLLSRAMLRKYPDTRIRQAIAGTGNPRHQAFEIKSGKRVAAGRYRFEVDLFFAYSGTYGDRLEVAEEAVVVARTDEGGWVVDDFPVPGSSPRELKGPLTVGD